MGRPISSRFAGWFGTIAVVWSFAGPTARADERSDPSIERMKKDIFFLASEECEGRGVETEGINKAADHIAAAFKEMGLKPAMQDGGYFQPFSIGASAKLTSPNALTLTGPLGQRIDAPYNKLFTVCGLSAKGKVAAPLVFVGYGISTKGGYDDYAGIDVAGKIVVVIRATPRSNHREAPFPNQAGGPLNAKIAAAEEHKAAAIIFVSDRQIAGNDDALMPFEYARGGGSAAIPAVHIRRALLDQMLGTQGRNLAEIEGEIDRELKPRSFELQGWTASIEASVERLAVRAKNVIGVLEGKGPLANETVIIGAHYDHLGRGEPGSLAKGSRAIHYGADDNGSGTTAMLELARRFAAMKEREGRRLVFMAFSGEERGLIGSAFYCRNPIFPLKETAVMINLDMVGRLRPDPNSKKDVLEIGGIGSAKNFEPLIDDLNKKYDFQIKKTRSGFGPSDHASFYGREVPVFFFFTQMHPEYHRPTDKPELINLQGMKKIVDMVEELTVKMTTEKERPAYVSSKGGPATPRSVPTIRFMPGDYDEDQMKGVLVGGVIGDGPADKGGMKAGDWIVEIAGQPVRNMDGYMKVMSAQKANEPVEFIVLRGKDRVKLSITPLPAAKPKS